MFNRLKLFSKLIKSGNQKELNRIQKIVQDSRDTDGEHLDETNESVHELVWMLETCLFQGIIPLKGNDDTDNVYSLYYSNEHFWHLIELLYERGSMAFGASIDMVKYCMNVKTDYGRCRAWIRQLLNQHALAFNIKAMYEDLGSKLFGEVTADFGGCKMIND